MPAVDPNAVASAYDFVDACVRARVRVRACVRMCVCGSVARAVPRTHTHTHTHTHSHTCTCTHAHTHTRTHDTPHTRTRTRTRTDNYDDDTATSGTLSSSSLRHRSKRGVRRAPARPHARTCRFKRAERRRPPPTGRHSLECFVHYECESSSKPRSAETLARDLDGRSLLRRRYSHGGTRSSASSRWRGGPPARRRERARSI
jgi:hypothetical protein